MKKSIAIIAAVLCAAVTAVQGETVLVDGIYYHLDKKTRTAEIYYDEDSDPEIPLPEEAYGRIHRDTLVLPSSVKYKGRRYRVTWCSSSGLRWVNMARVGTLVISEKIEGLYEYFFWLFDRLHTIVWLSPDARLGDEASFPASVRTVVFGEKVCSIPPYLCAGLDSLQSVTLPKKLTSIGAGAFYGCTALTHIELPDKLASIGEEAFNYCYRLENLNVPTSVKDIYPESFVGVLNVNIPGFQYLFSNERVYGWNCDGQMEYADDEEEIGEYVGSCAVNGFGEYPFVYADSCRFELLGCSPSVEGMVVIPDSVCYVGQYAFSGCKKIESVVVPSTIKAIDEHAFVGVEKVLYTGTLPGAPWGAKELVTE